MAAVEILLPAMAGIVEGHRMYVDPSSQSSPILDTNRKPVGLLFIAKEFESSETEIQVLGVDGQIEVSMLPRLGSDKGCHTPTASHPVADAVRRKLIQHSSDLTKQHSQHTRAYGLEAQPVSVMDPLWSVTGTAFEVRWKGSSTVLDPDGGLGHRAVVGVAVEVQGG